MTVFESFYEGSPYAGYLYSYPHKTAYRTLSPAVPLGELWADERRRVATGEPPASNEVRRRRAGFSVGEAPVPEGTSEARGRFAGDNARLMPKSEPPTSNAALSLYLHVPFCEMRCGFCNLFTRSRPPGEVVSAWLGTLRRQANVVRRMLGPAHFERFAIGGGTPTMLDPGQLGSLFSILGDFGVVGRPSSVETSPATATADRLAVLKEAGVTRVSIGVQSFEPTEVQSAQRPQSNPQVAAALDRIRAADFPVLNLDLIYGIPGQSAGSWIRSLEAALQWAPEELYLYPLYVRPLTGMAVRARHPEDAVRTELYSVGREFLLANGYTQASMRMFRRDAVQDGRSRAGARADGGSLAQAGLAPAGAYRCQEDGMIGLGVGARSYNRRLHYSTDYAVQARGVEGIIDDWITRSDAELGVANHGIWLDDAEQARRRLILTLLALEPVTEVPDELESAVGVLIDTGLAARGPEGITLTEAGIARSDAIGPALISPAVRARMAAWETR